MRPTTGYDEQNRGGDQPAVCKMLSMAMRHPVHPAHRPDVNGLAWLAVLRFGGVLTLSAVACVIRTLLHALGMR